MKPLLLLLFTASSFHVAAIKEVNHDFYHGLQLFSGESLKSNIQVKDYPITQLPVTQSLNKINSFNINARHWRVLWNHETHIPLRIYGEGIPARSSIASSTAARNFALSTLAAHVNILAPGAQATDFKLVANEVHNGVRTVGFKQYHQGLEVLGGQLSFRFKFNRLIAIASEALPNIDLKIKPASSKQMAEIEALDRVLREIDPNAILFKNASNPVILPLFKPSSGNRIEYVVVRKVVIKSEKPVGQWNVYVNAETNEPVGMEQTLMFGNGTMSYNTPIRWPGASRADYPATNTNITVDGGAAVTDAFGQFSFANASANVNAGVNGPYASVSTAQGIAGSIAYMINDGENFVWADASTEFIDAQITAFIHANFIKDYVRPWNPGLAWLDQNLSVTVNLNDTCNAYSDGDSINFFAESAQCSNTGRLPDVIYHEFGHSLHSQSIIAGAGAFDGSISEGIGDFLAATVTNDPVMGRGFYLSNDGLRDINPAGSEAFYPDDVIPGNPYSGGLIYAGTFWDLRESLINNLGLEPGVATTERLFYATIQRSSGITSAYIEALIEDDDDGNLANGTPNFCEIEAAFKLHGLTGNVDSPLFGQPTINGLKVSVPSNNATNCASEVTGMTLEWRNRNTPETIHSIAMQYANAIYFTHIPFNEAGEVVQYRITATFSEGETASKPKNIADQWYEQYTGLTEVISCTDFETDPMLSGWTHALTAGTVQPGADDWEWGTPMGTINNGDPTFAYSGAGVFGNDLGAIENYNGLYQANITNEANSPEIDVSAYEFVRLQYRRWLHVEDGNFDTATIYSNGNPVWSNFASGQNGNGTTHHQDQEWRFHDVDLTSTIVGNTVQLKYELASDSALNMGGWNIDDVCLVGYNGSPLSDIIFYDGF